MLSQALIPLRFGFRCVLMLLVVMHQGEPLKRDGCYINMAGVKVNDYRLQLDILKTGSGVVEKNVFTEKTSTEESCKSWCEESSCFLLVLDHSPHKEGKVCYTANEDAAFKLEPEETRTKHLISSFINVCGHGTRAADDCYHTATSHWSARGDPGQVLNISSWTECGEACNSEERCFGYYQHRAQCALYLDDSSYTVDLEEDGRAEHHYGFKKCFACADQPCMNGGTCAHISDTCCHYHCTCRWGYTGDNCEIDLGMRKTVKIIVITVLLVLLVSIVGLALACCYWRKRDSDQAGEESKGLRP